jgi:hypothetical protein
MYPGGEQHRSSLSRSIIDDRHVDIFCKQLSPYLNGTVVNQCTRGTVQFPISTFGNVFRRRACLKELVNNNLDFWVQSLRTHH